MYSKKTPSNYRLQLPLPLHWTLIIWHVWGEMEACWLHESGSINRSAMHFKLTLHFLHGSRSRKHNGLMGGRFCIYCNKITHSASFCCSGTWGTVMGSSAGEGWGNSHVEDEWTYAHCNFVFEVTYRNGFFEIFAICIRIQDTWIPDNCKFTVFLSVSKDKDFAFCHHI